MNNAWNSGVKIQAKNPIGSAEGLAGTSGAIGAGEGEGPGLTPGEGLPLNWAQPASTSRTSAPRSRGPSQRRTPRLASGERSSRLRRLANGVIPTWAPGMAAGDPPDAHPAALQ